MNYTINERIYFSWKNIRKFIWWIFSKGGLLNYKQWDKSIMNDYCDNCGKHRYCFAMGYKIGGFLCPECEKKDRFLRIH